MAARRGASPDGVASSTLDVTVGQDGSVPRSGRGFKGGGAFLLSQWGGGDGAGGGYWGGRGVARRGRGGAWGGRGAEGGKHPEAGTLWGGNHCGGGEREVHLQLLDQSRVPFGFGR